MFGSCLDVFSYDFGDTSGGSCRFAGDGQRTIVITNFSGGHLGQAHLRWAPVSSSELQSAAPRHFRCLAAREKGALESGEHLHK